MQLYGKVRQQCLWRIEFRIQKKKTDKKIIDLFLEYIMNIHAYRHEVASNNASDDILKLELEDVT